MIRLNMSVGKDLTIATNDSNYIKILRSQDENNAFELQDDGIYMSNQLVAEGDGFVDHSGGNMRVGWMSGYDRSDTPTKTGRVSANNVVHRIFTASEYTKDIPTNTIIKNLRNVDCIIPGDMIRVPTEDGKKYTYFLIKSTSTEDEKTGRVGNKITAVQSLGTW